MTEVDTSDYQIQTIVCPACNDENAKVITHILDIPYYDDFAMVNISCPKCGYRSSDFVNLKSKDPIHQKYHVTDESDGSTKIVRSTDGIVSIPELGVKIEPVSGGSSWIRNLEGILNDIKDKLIISLKQNSGDINRHEVKSRLKKLRKMIKFELSYTVEVQDPTGNSLILPADEGKLEQIDIKVDENNN